MENVLENPLIEYCYKKDELGDPLIAKRNIFAFNWASRKEIEKIDKYLLRMNDFMIGNIGIK